MNRDGRRVKPGAALSIRAPCLDRRPGGWSRQGAVREQGHDLMSGEPNHTVATATVTSEDKPYGVLIDAGGHALRGDEPIDHGGADTGPAPFALVSSGLGACTAITLRMYAERKNWPLAGINVTLAYIVESRNSRWIDRLITIRGLNDDQRTKLAEIAEKTPVTKAVRAGTQIRTTIEVA
jgi:putative redox protein